MRKLSRVYEAAVVTDLEWTELDKLYGNSKHIIVINKLRVSDNRPLTASELLATEDVSVWKGRVNSLPKHHRHCLLLGCIGEFVPEQPDMDRLFALIRRSIP